MAKVLVTGASGFIGKQLVEALVARGDDVSCLVRPSSVVEPLQKLGARLVTGDVTELESLPAAVTGIGVVYHLAGVTKAIGLAGYCRINEAGVRNVVEACARRTTPPVVLVLSSLAAAGPTTDADALRTEDDLPRPVSHYGRSKRAGEQAAEARAGDVPISIVRPPIVLGPGDETGCAMFRAIRRFRSFVVLGSGMRTSVVYVGDLATAVIAAAERGQRLASPSASGKSSGKGNDGTSHPSGVGSGYYFIAGDEHPPMLELGRMIAQSVGRPYAWAIRLPRPTAWILGIMGELMGRITRRPRYLNFDRAREVSAGHWVCSPEKARRDLGFMPAAPLAERIRQTAQWYRDHGWLKSIETSWPVRK